MKKIVFLLFLFLFSLLNISANNSFQEALENGKYSTNVRIFYFDRGYKDKTRTKALAAGMIMKYESSNYLGFKMGLAYYGSHRIGGFFSRERGKDSSILAKDGEDINLLGEAYLQYNLNKTVFKLGRQQLSTPLIQNHDLRILPSVYEAFKIKNNNFSNTILELAYVKAYTGFGSKENRFLEFDSSWGKDGLAYIYIVNKSIKNLIIKAQFVQALSDQDKNGNQIAIKNYRYADLKYELKDIGINSYIKMQYGGNSYNNAKDSIMFGVKVGTSVGMFDLTLLGNKIMDNNFKAVRSGPMYSDYQQGYGAYEPSSSYGAQIVTKFLEDVSLKIAIVNVMADSGYDIDDYVETNLDLKYQINSYSKIRVRYSLKDQTSSSSKDDRDDFRIIYYINF